MGEVAYLRQSNPTKTPREATLSAMLTDTAEVLDGLEGGSDAERVAIQAQAEAIRDLVDPKGLS